MILTTYYLLLTARYYFDNKRVCELLEGKKPTSVVELLDEESIMPQVS